MEKEQLRERVWDALEDSGEARFPFPPHGRIPNFAGAEAAAERLAATGEFRRADAIKANPDAPQRPVRRLALEAGKTVYMAVPRLADDECFLELDPGTIDDLDRATTISGSSELGEQVGPEAVAGVELVVSGSVAVTGDGARVGKGEGFSDLEYAVLLELGLVDGTTPVATTVHERQVVDDVAGDVPVEAHDVPVEAHDVPLDIVATPDRLVRTGTPHERPSGIDWDALSDERRAEIPVLSRFAPDRE